ncbi:TPR-like protein [Calocera cornea HHB12733]|uniref:TPR-like protein n=1 Tax=Calocera cornea HHB12733 TaxID=1353952 RepID=A0A165EXU4_9BASI|nr:TPR-like protein [Calocera cornea HHB12733]
MDGSMVRDESGVMSNSLLGMVSEEGISNVIKSSFSFLSMSTVRQKRLSSDWLSASLARFALQTVIHPSDLPDGMYFDPHTKAIVPRPALPHCSRTASASASPGVSQTERKKVFIFARNAMVADMIETTLDRFGIAEEGVVDGADDVEDRMVKRRLMTHVRYGLSVELDGEECILNPSSKITNAFPRQLAFKIVNFRRLIDAKRQSTDKPSVLGLLEDIQPDNPVFILRRAPGNSTMHNSGSSRHLRHSVPLDSVALAKLHAERRASASMLSMSSNRGSTAMDQDNAALSRQEIIHEQRAQSRAQQNLRSTKSSSSSKVQYLYIHPDGETYDVSDIIEDELGVSTSKNNMIRRSTALDMGSMSGTEDLLEEVLVNANQGREARGGVDQRLERVLNQVQEKRMSRTSDAVTLPTAGNKRLSSTLAHLGSYYSNDAQRSPRLDMPFADDQESYFKQLGGAGGENWQAMQVMYANVLLAKARQAPKLILPTAKRDRLESEVRDKAFYINQAVMNLARMDGAVCQQTILQLLSKAVAQMAENAYDVAGRTFDEILHALMGKGCIQYACRGYREATKTFQHALALSPHMLPDPRVGIGMCAWSLGDRERAKHAWQRSLEVHPDLEAPQIFLGLSLLNNAKDRTQSQKEQERVYNQGSKRLAAIFRDKGKFCAIVADAISAFFIERKGWDRAIKAAERTVHIRGLATGWPGANQGEQDVGKTKACELYKCAARIIKGKEINTDGVEKTNGLEKPNLWVEIAKLWQADDSNKPREAYACAVELARETAAPEKGVDLKLLNALAGIWHIHGGETGRTEVRDLYQEALTVASKDEGAENETVQTATLYNLARCWETLGEQEYVDAKTSLAHIYQQQGRIDEAHVLLKDALESQMDNLDLRAYDTYFLASNKQSRPAPKFAQLTLSSYDKNDVYYLCTVAANLYTSARENRDSGARR